MCGLGWLVASVNWKRWFAMDETSHFSVKTIGLSRTNGRKPCTLLEAARHNLREIQAELGAVGHIDAQRMADNIIMAGPAAAIEVQAQADALLASVDTAKLKRDHVQAIEAVFSLPAGSSLDVGAYFAGCLAWLRVALPLPILSAVAHHDEAAPHAHVLLLPVVDGKHIGGALLKLAELKRLRESFFQQVAGPAGLKRDRAKVRGSVKQWAVAAVLRACDAHGLPAANGPLWPILKAAIERDPTQAMKALCLDVNALRPLDAKPIGLDARAIGLQKPIGLDGAIENEVVLKGSKIEALSCVGLAVPTPQKFTKKSPPEVPPTAHAADMVGTYKRLAHGAGGLFACALPARLSAARAAQRVAIAKATCKRCTPSDEPAAPTAPADDVVRVKDEHCHDTSAQADRMTTARPMA